MKDVRLNTADITMEDMIKQIAKGNNIDLDVEAINTIRRLRNEGDTHAANVIERLLMELKK